MKNKKLYIGLAAVVVVAALAVGFSGSLFQGRFIGVKPLSRSVVQPVNVQNKVVPYSIYATRGSLANSLVAAFGEDVHSYTGCFSDVAGTSYENSVCFLKSIGIVGDMGGSYQPSHNVNRAEAAKFMATFYMASSNLYSGTEVLYPDVDSSAWYYNYVNTLGMRNILDVAPNANQDFRPSANLKQSELNTWINNAKNNSDLRAITRAELAKFIAEELNPNPVTASVGCAPDVSGYWYETYACYLMANDIMDVYPDGLFHPEYNVNRAEAAKYYSAAFAPVNTVTTVSYFSDVSVNDWYATYVNKLVDSNIVTYPPKNTNSKFRPSANFNIVSAANWIDNLN